MKIGYFTNSSTFNNPSHLHEIKMKQPRVVVPFGKKQNVDAIYFIDFDFRSFTFITHAWENLNFHPEYLAL